MSYGLSCSSALLLVKHKHIQTRSHQEAPRRRPPGGPPGPATISSGDGFRRAQGWRADAQKIQGIQKYILTEILGIYGTTNCRNTGIPKKKNENPRNQQKRIERQTTTTILQNIWAVRLLIY